MSDKKPEWSVECVVFGCENRSDQGNFNGPICMACWNMITTGKFSPGKTFIHRLKSERDAFESRAIKAVEIIDGIAAEMKKL